MDSERWANSSFILGEKGSGFGGNSGAAILNSGTELSVSGRPFRPMLCVLASLRERDFKRRCAVHTLHNWRSSAVTCQLPSVFSVSSVISVVDKEKRF